MLNDRLHRTNIHVLVAGLVLGACSSTAPEPTGTSDTSSSGSSASGTAGWDASTGAQPSTPHASGSSITTSGGANPGTIAIPDKGNISVGTTDAGTLVVLCGDNACECNDGLDNDGDGTSDGFDGECTGPFDSDESSFATGIPGDNRDPKWQDCFFDGNSGAGDDGCRYSTGCLDGTLEPNDPDCSVAQRCVDYCAPLAPPGCDCFGCCDVTVGGVNHSVLISDSCSTENIDDPAVCQPCVPTQACQNECGECELCLGKTIDDLPAHCSMTPPVPSQPTPTGAPPDAGTDAGTNTDGGVPDPGPPGPTPPPPTNTCDNGAQACGSSAECGASSYCSLGCCRLVVQVL